MNRNYCTVEGNWLDDTSYQVILRETHMIAFEYDMVQGKQRVSPFISEYIAGNYDGRLLSDVMLEDHVIHPSDVPKALAFRDQVMAGQVGEMAVRLMTPSGKYRWFRMVMTGHESAEKRQMYVGVLADVEIQMQYQELLRHRAEIDPVSGIYNRETFFEQTEKLLGAESDQLHFLLCFDIERFKLINELFGISVGDQVLHRLGDILREQALPGETFGRLHNDMFGMCLGRDREDTIAVAKNIEDEMQNYPIVFRFFLPAGIIPITPGCKDPVNVLCDKAVLAQHKIKGSYLYSYSFYEPYMGETLNREHILIISMEKALEEKQFEAYYQPQFDICSGQIIGAEALARWQHPTLGMISPAEFIPLFERNGFVVKLDEYIWELACQTIRGWIDNNMQPVPISVNVSRVHLYDTNFHDKIITLCSHYDIPKSLLQLEITESAYTEQPQELFPIMDSLRRFGFIFAMDDFGSGYSSLNILKDIPISIVKFDLRFLEQSRNGTQAGRSILKHMIQLIKDLQLSVLAEGVENEEQVDFLRSVGCFYAQGFYYAKPMPLSELGALLIDRNNK